jgi:hypothetical protein
MNDVKKKKKVCSNVDRVSCRIFLRCRSPTSENPDIVLGEKSVTEGANIENPPCRTSLDTRQTYFIIIIISAFFSSSDSFFLIDDRIISL